MSSRKNMLEAFSTPEPPQGAAPSGRAAGLTSTARDVSGGGRRALFVAVGLCLAFALGYAVGRGSPPVAEAREEPPEPAPAPRPSAQPRSFQPRASGAEPAAGASAQRIEDSALYDAANKYTLVVEAYSKTSPDFAWATHDHLKEEGLDVFPPVASGNLLLVLVGAAPRSADLAEVEARVRKLERDGKKEYDDAYRQPIDKLISRNLEKD